MKAILRKFLMICLLAGVSWCTQAGQNDHTSGYIKVDQGQLYYQTFGAGELPIVVVHGGPGLDQTYLQPQLLELAQNNKVIFYDQRGSGKSLDTKLTPELINLEQFTKDLEQLRIQLKLDRFILLGHSWGGYLAMNYATKFPDHLTGLILLDTAAADTKGQKVFAEELNHRIEPIKEKLAPLFNIEEFKKLNESQIATLYKTLLAVYFYDPKLADKLTIKIDKKSAVSGQQVMALMSQSSWIVPGINLFPELQHLRIPTLLIHGEQDIIPVWTAQQIAEAIPNAQLFILSKTGHFPYIEQPGKLFMLLNQFIKDRGN